MKDERLICFLMPGPDSGPVGGYKVVYEYANRFASDGWQVAITYPLTSGDQSWCEFVWALLCHPRSTWLGFWSSLKAMARQKIHGIEWFKLDSRVKCIWPLSLARSFGKELPEGTRYVATYIWTASRLLNIRAARHKYQLIQDRENWGGVTLDELYETYRYPITKVAISKWVLEGVEEAGSTAEYIPNGLDFEYFKMTNPIEGRSRYEVAMLWHHDERKRTEDAVAALKIVKAKHPQLHVTAFGVSDKPMNLPEWITYVQRPNKERHNEIYNTAAIFVASSEQEGWGLTPSEAMICGAAIACTDIGGYKSFAEVGVNALMSPVRDPDALAKNICRLIEDDELRIRLAKKGNETIKEFTWENSFGKMKALMERV